MGAGGHNLYRYNWMWFGAFQAIAVYVARRRDAKDRRVVRARITRSGLELLGALDKPLREFVQGLAAPASADF